MPSERCETPSVASPMGISSSSIARIGIQLGGGGLRFQTDFIGRDGVQTRKNRLETSAKPDSGCARTLL